MSDITELLQQAGHPGEPHPSRETVEADVRRGRAALARTRRRFALRASVIGVAAASALVVGALAIGPEDAGGPHERGQAASPPAGDPPSAGAQVELVAYTEEQLDGFIVDRVPQGWFLQGSSQFSLTIAPEGDNTHPDNFIGKLVVMLLSQDARQELPRGEPVEVAGEDGVVDHQGPVTVLTYTDADGRFVQIQAPKALGWATDQLTRFAEGVEVTANAKQGRG
jgi:hypothetical protein